MKGAGLFVVAERYARALLEVALDKEADLDVIGRELAEIAELLQEHPRLADALATPAIASENRVAVINDVFGKQNLTPATVNLVRLLTVRERMSAFGLVVEQYRRLLLEHKLIQPGEVTSAHPLTDQQQKRLSDGLGEALGKRMELSFENDADLIGGLVVRVGNRVYDASVINQLARIKEKALSGL